MDLLSTEIFISGGSARAAEESEKNALNIQPKYIMLARLAVRIVFAYSGRVNT